MSRIAEKGKTERILKAGNSGDPVFQVPIFQVIGAFSAASAILVGAFAAHGMTDPEAIAWVKTGAHYQLVHGVALLLVMAFFERLGKRAVISISWLLTVGILLFSGSLYLLAATGVRILGAVTPVGGICLILAWCWWGVSLCRASR